MILQDVTDEKSSIGRLIDHGRKVANLIPRWLLLKNSNISASLLVVEDKELFYDYGEKKKNSSILIIIIR